MRILRALLPSILFGAALAGCGTVRQTYFVDREFEPERRKGIRLDKIYVAPDVKEIVGADLVVELADPRTSIQGKRKIKEGRDFEAFAIDLERVISDSLWRTRIFRDVGTPRDEVPIPRPTLRLEVAITEWHEGSAWLRFLVGTWIGATRVQTEGRFVNPETGHVYLAFADAQRHPGYGKFNPMTYRPQTLIASDLSFLVRDLQRDIVTLTEQEIPPGGFRSRSVRPRPSRRIPASTERAIGSPALPPEPRAIDD